MCRGAVYCSSHKDLRSQFIFLNHAVFAGRLHIWRLSCPSETTGCATPQRQDTVLSWLQFINVFFHLNIFKTILARRSTSLKWNHQITWNFPSNFTHHLTTLPRTTSATRNGELRGLRHTVLLRNAPQLYKLLRRNPSLNKYVRGKVNKQVTNRDWKETNGDHDIKTTFIFQRNLHTNLNTCPTVSQVPRNLLRKILVVAVWTTCTLLFHRPTRCSSSILVRPSENFCAKLWTA